METLKYTDLGKQRIVKNLNLPSDIDVESYIMSFLKKKDLTVEAKGKNIYVSDHQVVLTINKNSHTLITAHCKQKKHYVYMLRCENGTLYTGYTVDLRRRIKMHNQKNGAKYTRVFGPVKLVYYEIYDDQSSALKREHAIKQLHKSEKERMVADFAAKQQEALCVFNV